MIRCTRAGCQGEGKWAPKLCVPALGREGSAVDVILSLTLCDSCAVAVTAADLVAGGGDPGRDLIRAAVSLQAAGRFLPDFERAQLVCVPLAIANAAALGRLS